MPAGDREVADGEHAYAHLRQPDRRSLYPAVCRDVNRRLEADRQRGDHRAKPGPAYPPLMAEPTEQRAGHDAASKDEPLAPDKGSQRGGRKVRVLHRAERHDGVAGERGRGAREPQCGGAAWQRLCPACQERDRQLRRREQADVGGPGVGGQAAQVLIGSAEPGRQKEHKTDDHERQGDIRDDPPDLACGWAPPFWDWLCLVGHSSCLGQCLTE